MSGPVASVEAIVLRQTDYGEADLILHLLTRSHGRKAAFARAARRSRKRFGAAVTQFATAQMQYVAGRGGMLQLQDADLLVARSALEKNYDALVLASYAVELIEVLLGEDEANESAYVLLSAFLDYLPNCADLATARLLFELRFVYLLGYVPHLLHCSHCLQVFSKEDKLWFDASQGGALCAACHGDSGMAIHLQTAGSLAKTLAVDFKIFAGFKYSDLTLRESLHMLQQVYQQILPRQLKSAQFISWQPPLS